MSRKPKWLKALVTNIARRFACNKEPGPTHQELIDEDFPIRRMHRTAELPGSLKEKRQGPGPGDPGHGAAGSKQGTDRHVSQAQSGSHIGLVSTTSGSPTVELNEDEIKSRVREQAIRQEKIGRRSENNLVAQARRTVNDMPCLPPGAKNEMKGHWFNNGQSKYPNSGRATKSADSWSRLESFLATHAKEEIQALDPTYPNTDEER